MTFKKKAALFLLLILILLYACVKGENDLGNTLPSQTQTFLNPPDEPTLTPSPTETQLIATQVLTKIEATVWETAPRVPILNYHRFLPDYFPQSSGTKLRLSEFEAHLQTLYNAGFSLISIDNLLDGEIHVPEGRLPLIISFDDAYYADQLFLEEDGEPSQLCGVGVLNSFAKLHPDFGFSVALFTNFGDKFYANLYTGEWWIVGDGWQEDLAKTIVWGIEHNVMPYNHLYLHPKLDITEEKDIQPQALQNDFALRVYLRKAGREDLVEIINNYIALPFGIWPATSRGKELLINYSDPEGRPVRAVFEAGYEYDPTFARVPFDQEFNPYDIPRMAGLNMSIDAIVGSKEDLPRAKKCTLMIEDTPETERIDAIANAIISVVEKGECSQGFYLVGGLFFEARDNQVAQIKLNY